VTPYHALIKCLLIRYTVANESFQANSLQRHDFDMEPFFSSRASLPITALALCGDNSPPNPAFILSHLPQFEPTTNGFAKPRLKTGWVSIPLIPESDMGGASPRLCVPQVLRDLCPSDPVRCQVSNRTRSHKADLRSIFPNSIVLDSLPSWHCL